LHSKIDLFSSEKNDEKCNIISLKQKPGKRHGFLFELFIVVVEPFCHMRKKEIASFEASTAVIIQVQGLLDCDAM
jgi:hypothetical protein